MRRIAFYGALWIAVVSVIVWRREEEQPIGRIRWYLLILTTLLFIVALTDAGY